MPYVLAFYEIGDRVVMNMDAETRGWGGKGVPNGTIGHVVGYRWVIDYAARFGIDTFSYDKPGIYEKRVGLEILWPDDSRTTEQYCDPVNREKYEQRRENIWAPILDDKEAKRALTREFRIGDLPETDLWEGDIAEIVFDGEKHFALITSIEYRYLYQMAHDQTSPMHGHALYNFRFCDENGHDLNRGSSWCGTKNSKLHKRGHVWRWYHNEPAQFSSIEEEIGLHCGLYKYDEVRNPANGFFKWTGTEALQAVRDGIGDGFSVSGFLMLPRRPHVRKFHDRDLGERVRQATIAGFAGKETLPEPA